MINISAEKYAPLQILAMPNRVILMPLSGISSSITSDKHPVAVTELTSGLFILGAVENRTLGVVVAVCGGYNTMSSLAVGSVVYYSIHAATEMALFGREYVHIRLAEVLAQLSLDESELLMNDDRILIMPDEAKPLTVSGIIIPDECLETPVTGTFLKAGPNAGPAFQSMARGQKILYHEFAGTEILFKTKEGTTRLMISLRESECIGLIDG